MVVTEGLTDRLLFKATEPIPLLIEAEVALVVVQDSVADWPAVIVVGLAVKVAVGGAEAFTETMTCWVMVPPGPVTVNV